ncbi:MAG: phage tail assembly chaperone [Bilophila wadsworthia]
MQFTIKDKTFDSGRLNAFQQLHVVRRLAPVTERLVALAGSAGDPEAFLGPLARTVGELPDADVDYILNACLDVTQIRQDTGGFARLRVNGVVMFPLDLTMLLGIAAHVLKDNLSGFSQTSSVLNRAGRLRNPKCNAPRWAGLADEAGPAGAVPV